MSNLCSDQELISLSSAILACVPSVSLTKEGKPLVLAIRKLKRFITSDSQKILTWNYNIIKARSLNREVADPINVALINLLKDFISFHEAISNESLFVLLLNLIKKEPQNMTWLLCLLGEKIPRIVTARMHSYIILELASLSNPFLGSTTDTPNADQSNVIYMIDTLFSHLLNLDQHKETVIESLLSLVDGYLSWIENNDPLDTELKRFTLGYVLSLPSISQALFEACWPQLFRMLYTNQAAGSIFLYEKNNQQSIAKTCSGRIQKITDIFQPWLTAIAFNANGPVMKHAMDVAIMLDTLAHDTRLGLAHLIPTGNTSILDSLRPSFEKLDVRLASIDLVDWAIASMQKGRGVDDLKIPLFLLQLVILKKDVTKDQVVDMFVQLIIRLQRPMEDDEKFNQGARYLIFNLVASTDTKWPGLFASVLEDIFSRAIAMHILDSAGSVNVEKILGNLAMLFETSEVHGFITFQTYLSQHWRQVLLLFLNHPSMECRAMGYRVLTNSKFWQSEGCDLQLISKLIIDAWFRHIKGRYLRIGQKEEMLVINEHQRLISHCCQNIELAKVLLSYTMDCILGGALELFPTVDVNALQQEKLSLYDKVTRETQPPKQQQSTFRKPPQFVTMIDFSGEEGLVDVRDAIYVDNIEITAALFFQFGELSLVTTEQYHDVSRYILNRLNTIWAPSTVSLDTYDDALPFKIPYQSDIAIGSAFKDHPILFIIFEKYMLTGDCLMANDITRSILVYFIVFWNMKEVVNVPTTLKFATQLEETTRLLFLLKRVLPDFLIESYHVFPFMSAKDLGDILLLVIWYYLRWSSSGTHIPGIKKVVFTGDSDELKSKCKQVLMDICEKRLKLLENVPSWHTLLKAHMSNIDSLNKP